MMYSQIKKLVDNVCLLHNLYDDVDVVLERDFVTGEASNIVITSERINPDRVITITINGKEKVKDD